MNAAEAQALADGIKDDLLAIGQEGFVIIALTHDEDSADPPVTVAFAGNSALDFVTYVCNGAVSTFRAVYGEGPGHE